MLFTFSCFNTLIFLFFKIMKEEKQYVKLTWNFKIIQTSDHQLLPSVLVLQTVTGVHTLCLTVVLTTPCVVPSPNHNLLSPGHCNYSSFQFLVQTVLTGTQCYSLYCLFITIALKCRNSKKPLLVYILHLGYCSIDSLSKQRSPGTHTWLNNLALLFDAAGKNPKGTEGASRRVLKKLVIGLGFCFVIWGRV